MGDYIRRFKGRLGKAEGLTPARPFRSVGLRPAFRRVCLAPLPRGSAVAGAHQLARIIIWALIVSGRPYDQAKAFAFASASSAKRLKKPAKPGTRARNDPRSLPVT